MLAIVLIHYKVSLDTVNAHTLAHRAYLAQLHEQGLLVASGPFVPRTGGALLLRVPDEATISSIIAKDPFHIEGVAEHEVRVWAPTIGATLLEQAP